ncbi:DUF2514 domain-containing protein [Burkholderia multivorans]|uniref:DUF2514 family protein n=1 Tax=Burkholderia multivorans TaxID=87883 RepID=UPI002019FDE9|nr:DUF2514 family protein [Burkholderia multivorans]MCO1358811.1 DUF2514 domain-containing protein [Burkholderia multivorans]MCO1418639.1 DUF2514 domain-containing protein [Burkholderia multivorans]UQO98141.1 DUF2514 domain-containing protein [Burkholderia multivorans]
MMIGDPRFWLAVVVACVIGVTGGYCKGHHDADQSATVADQAKQIRELKAARDEYQRRTTAQQENASHAAKERDQARADAAAAVTAADGLRKQVAGLVERARHPAATPGSAAAGDALDLLADVLGRADQRAGELAEYADRARIAGQQCERDYDALTIGSSASRN